MIEVFRDEKIYYNNNNLLDPAQAGPNYAGKWRRTKKAAFSRFFITVDEQKSHNQIQSFYRH
ncbi:hypothetical protein B6N58_05160 [Legionella micdadei]|nr:hypothetical protein B6N58_05160 [Legionella micdadei]